MGAYLSSKKLTNKKTLYAKQDVTEYSLTPTQTTNTVVNHVGSVGLSQTTCTVDFYYNITNLALIDTINSKTLETLTVDDVNNFSFNDLQYVFVDQSNKVATVYSASTLANVISYTLSIVDTSYLKISFTFVQSYLIGANSRNERRFGGFICTLKYSNKYVVFKYNSNQAKYEYYTSTGASQGQMVMSAENALTITEYTRTSSSSPVVYQTIQDDTTPVEYRSSTGGSIIGGMRNWFMPPSAQYNPSNLTSQSFPTAHMATIYSSSSSSAGYLTD